MLQLSGADVTPGQVILTANIPNLVFTPATNANGTGYASLTFSVRDTNGPAFDPIPNTITFDVTAVNDPPVIAFTAGDIGVNEGETKTYTFSITDSDTITFTYESLYPKCGAGGSIVGAPTIGSSSGSFQCSFPDGPASPVVAVKIRDATAASNEITRASTSPTCRRS